MSLAVWLPLNGDLHNQGLKNITITNNGATTNNNGKIGQCYSFNGSSNYLFGSASGLNNSTTEYSYACWLKLNNTSHTGCLFSNRTAVSPTGFTIFYASGQFYFDDGDRWNFTPASALVTNTWYHICFTWKKNVGIKYYCNGVLKNQTTTTHTPTTVSTQFTIGKSQNTATTVSSSGGNPLNGYLNDVRVYDHCLSPKEVEEIAKGLVLHYKLDYSNPNLLSKYVTPGQAAPGGTATAGRTNYYGDYGIVIPATENADTYFRLFLKQQLTQNTVYTISCYVSGLLPGSSYNFPLFAQGNASMGVLSLNHNGLCSLTFTMNSSTQTSVTTPDGSTVYICFMDDSGRALASGQGAITITGFKIEQGNVATPFNTGDTSVIYDSSGYSHNGTIVGSLTAAAPSPRYDVATYKPNGAYIRIDNRPNTIGAKDAITVSMWVNFSTWGNCISCTEGEGWNFEEAGGGLRFPIYIASVGYKVAQSTITSASLKNAWHMLTGTMDSNNVKFYVDGEEAGTIATGSTNGIGYANNYIFIGGEAGGNSTSPASSAFVGTISDARIYATALTVDQIKELYNTSMSIDSNGNVYARELVEL